MKKFNSIIAIFTLLLSLTFSYNANCQILRPVTRYTFSNNSTYFNVDTVSVYFPLNFNAKIGFSLPQTYTDSLFYKNSAIFTNIRNNQHVGEYNSDLYVNEFYILRNRYGNRFPLYLYSNSIPIKPSVKDSVKIDSMIYQTTKDTVIDNTKYRYTYDNKIYTYNQNIYINDTLQYTLKLDTLGFKDIYHKRNETIDLSNIINPQDKIKWFYNVSMPTSPDSCKKVTLVNSETICSNTFESKDTSITTGTVFKGITYNVLSNYTVKDTVPSGECQKITTYSLTVVCGTYSANDTTLYLQNNTVSFNNKTYTTATLAADTIVCTAYTITVKDCQYTGPVDTTIYSSGSVMFNGKLYANGTTNATDTVKYGSITNDICGKIYRITVALATGAPEDVQAHVIAIHPNPCAGSFTALSNEPGTVAITTLSGVLLHSQSIAAGSTLITTGLPAGMYLLRLSTAAGTSVQRLAVE